ncbi:sensor histidine kinase [Paenibacillus physcomitrellae]|uniref:histidine kinase n=1 Tax=Paenibacillus physcomitrellae TaxID=1619311 RepID=A0ABQ1GLY7_9BACL|nr:HAMP domain-containing sensor histidine kinase [Paenibacillus physcomitrellae]GGA46452.1 two-component sensor histidine kinase [Paenibacillus physcomitrellae]
MSKLTRKLVTRITLALCAVFILTFAVNTYFLPKYFLYQKKVKLAELTNELASLAGAQPNADGLTLADRIQQVEADNEVTVVYAPLSESLNDLNSDILLQLNRKGIALSKFWLSEESLAQLHEGRQVNKIYDQTKLKSSFLVNFVPLAGNVVAIGESISYSSETIGIINRFNWYIWAGMLLLLILLSALYTARIVKPLAKLSETAKSIADLTFIHADVRTGDEIESLADSINRMSDKLKKTQRSLEARNANLRTFIADVSHELKTPLALIQAYAAGIQDGLDDGTYPEVIRRQTEEMAGMIDRLLELSKLQTESYELQPTEFHSLLIETLENYQVAFRQRGLGLMVEDVLPPEVWVMADQHKLESVLHNLLSNALKYSEGNRVEVLAEVRSEQVHFRIANRADTRDEARWERIWEPFFVMEESRSKHLSGTGLGLSITGTILLKHQAAYGHEAGNGRVEFYFSLPVLPGS